MKLLPFASNENLKYSEYFKLKLAVTFTKNKTVIESLVDF